MNHSNLKVCVKRVGVLPQKRLFVIGMFYWKCSCGKINVIQHRIGGRTFVVIFRPNVVIASSL